MKKEMLINVLQPEECRIAILEDGSLEELYIERTSQESYVGNVYKGKIVNIEPSIQAAFVDFGIGRNGFLHVSDVDPAYYRHLAGGGQRSPSEGISKSDERRHDDGRGGRRGDRRDDRRGERQKPREDRGARDAGPRQRQDDRHPAPRRDDDFDDEPRGRRNPPVEPPVREVSEQDDDFASGLLDEPPTSARQAVPAVEEEFDDPYAKLVGQFGGDAADEPAPVKEPKPRRGRSRPEAKAEAAERPAPPPPVVPPAPEPAADDDSGHQFGAGLDLWGDEPPPPLMPTAERRLPEDEENEFGPTSSGFGDDSDDEAGDAYGDQDGDDDEDDDHSEDDGDDEGGASGRRRGGRRFDRNRRRGGRDGDGHQKPLIQNIFKRGQEVLVQVIKEGIGTKGPTLSTYISIAGRYLVLMPGLSRVGVSRKITDVEQRHRLRDILAELKPPTGLGFIIRTAGTDRTKKELQNDLHYLLRVWQVIVKRIKAQNGPGVIHTESDIITRTLRDAFTTDVDAIWIDEPTSYQHAREFLEAVMPRYAGRLKLYDQIEPLFHRYQLDPEIAKIQQKKLALPGGGSIVIEQTEALVAIDVNSGSFRAADNNAEETAFQINLAAAKEIARQLRLRDLGGVIVNDFIDMKDDKHRRAVEKAMRDALKRDRARTKVLRISQFGLIEMTRQRIRPSLRRSVFQECPHCAGIGYVKTPESMSIEVMRMVQLAACRETIRRVDVRVHSAVADYLVNRRRREIAQLEDRGGMTVSVIGLRDVAPERLELVCLDANGSEVPLAPPAPVARQHHHRRR
jgi:ribonuclease E